MQFGQNLANSCPSPIPQPHSHLMVLVSQSTALFWTHQVMSQMPLHKPLVPLALSLGAPTLKPSQVGHIRFHP